MKKQFFVALIGSIFFASLTVHAEGSGAHGGDAVVWFSIPIPQAVVKADRGYVMTPAGRKHINKVETVEYVRAGKLVETNVLLQSLQEASFEKALRELTAAWFSDAPSFKKFLLEARDAIGLVTEGIPAENGEYDLPDEGVIFPTPPGTVRLQAILRQGDQLQPDSDLISRMTGMQKALMQIHEEILWIGNTKFDHNTSMQTQLLILERIAGKRSLDVSLAEFVKGYKYTVQFVNRADLLLMKSTYVESLRRAANTWSNYQTRCAFKAFDDERMVDQTMHQISYEQGALLKDHSGLDVLQWKMYQLVHAGQFMTSDVYKADKCEEAKKMIEIINKNAAELLSIDL